MRLVIKNISKSFGKFYALNNINFNVEDNELKIIIGPNGAGKTTFVNVITGVLKEDKGDILLNDKKINHLPSYKRVHLGISRTFQVPSPFFNMTVYENILAGAIFSKRIEKDNILNKVEEILNILEISKLRDIPVKNLPTDQIKMVDFGRALAENPKFLFLDEIGAGLTDKEILDLAYKIKKIKKDFGLSIIYIGHVMRLVKELGGLITVFNNGKILTEGKYNEVLNNSEVRKIYFGE
jgi:branched-chain amino acid transport system ATP-binding protein